MRAVDLGTCDIKKYIEFRRSSSQGFTTYRGRLDSPKQIPICPASNATINRELALLKRAYSLGWKHTPRQIETLPYIRLMKENNVRKGFFEHDDFLAVRQNLPADLRAFFTFAYYTGCRLGEIQNIRMSQVDLGSRIVRLDPESLKHGYNSVTVNQEKDKAENSLDSKLLN